MVDASISARLSGASLTGVTQTSASPSAAPRHGEPGAFAQALEQAQPRLQFSGHAVKRIEQRGAAPRW